MFQNSEIEDVVCSLQNYILANNYAGYDPYDLRGDNGVFLFLQRSVVGKGLLLLLNANAPLFTRKILRIKKTQNSKTLALCLRAYALLYKKTAREDYLNAAKDVARRLIAMRNEDYKAWGYPFKWQSSGGLLEKNVPSIVVTSFCGQAILDYYELVEDENILDAAIDAGCFMLNRLNRSDDSGFFCFSYTPVDKTFVHNANVLGAAFLARLFAVTGKDEFREAAINAVNFTISQQRENGSFEYYIDKDVKEEFIDNYHTGFVLESINDCARYLKSKAFSGPLKKGLRFYKEKLFFQKKIPLYRTTSPLPVDIHSVAESLAVLSRLKDVEDSSDYLKNIFDWAIKEMYNKKEGSFYYWVNHLNGLENLKFKDRRLRLLNFFTINSKTKIPYMRWSVAWMFWALANIYPSGKK